MTFIIIVLNNLFLYACVINSFPVCLFHVVIYCFHLLLLLLLLYFLYFLTVNVFFSFGLFFYGVCCFYFAYLFCISALFFKLLMN